MRRAESLKSFRFAVEKIRVLERLAWMALAGVAGTLARYGLSVGVQLSVGGRFPWGTLAVNGLGCMLFGVVWASAEERQFISAETRLIILVGFMGAFTTFSTFAFETGQMMRDGEWIMVAGNLAAQNILGIAFLFLGLAIGRAL